MKIPRWFWWLLGIVAAIVSTPFLFVVYRDLAQALDERPRPFEWKVQLKGAAVWNSGFITESAGGYDCTVEKETLQFARTGQPRENVDAIESAECSQSFKIYQVAWFDFGNGTYLRVGDDIYWRVSQGRWRKRSADWKNGWSLSHVKTNEGQIIYKRTTKARTFYCIFQLPQKVGGKWILKNRPLPR